VRVGKDPQTWAQLAALRHESGRVEAEAVLLNAVDAYRAALGERLMAVYALGSLAHGGFSPLVSDIDLGLIVQDPVRSGDARTIRAVAEKTRGAPLSERLSVFWGSPSTLRGERPGGRFPPLDRLDLLEHGRLLVGVDARSGLCRPSAEELLVSGAEFALEFLAGVRDPGDPRTRGRRSPSAATQDAVEEIRRPELLLARGVRRLTKLALFPVRFLFAATGLLGSNEDAVAWYVTRGNAPGTGLVAAALAWRTVPPDEKAAVELLHRQVVPLYLHYVDDHIARLESSDRSELARAFERLRECLTR
jgi:hypothetical protein